MKMFIIKDGALSFFFNYLGFECLGLELIHFESILDIDIRVIVGNSGWFYNDIKVKGLTKSIFRFEFRLIIQLLT